MRNVDFRVGGDIVLHIRRMNGMMRGRGGVVDFDDKTSFATWISRAEVGLTAEDLTHLMNNHVFAYRGAPLRDLKIELRDGHMIQSGILHKGVDIPFKMKAEVSVTSDGMLRIHPIDTDIFCVDGDALMGALHLTLEKMVDVSKAVGVRIKGNDFLIAPTLVLPPPKINARLLAVRIEGNQLVQQLGPLPGNEELLAMTPPTPPDTTARNYMYYKGGKLKLAHKLLMSRAEMQVVDDAPGDAFDFDIDHYIQQLIAGYSRTMPSLGLWVSMPDAHRVARIEQTVGGEVSLGPRDTSCNCAAPQREKRPRHR